jgi:prolyl-tRNA editing enzyme YbaK/EbsC (Cys-tRNA(Pro) deacylase)
MALHPTALKLRERLRRAGLDVDIRELADSTRTAADAAAAVDVEVGQIVKSLVFSREAHDPVLVLCAGDRHVDTTKLGDDVKPARADQVRAVTGFSIGGVPPLGHDRPLRTIVDESLRRFDAVWCAAGTPHAVFRIETDALIGAIPDADVRSVS